MSKTVEEELFSGTEESKSIGQIKISVFGGKNVILKVCVLGGISNYFETMLPIF